MHIDTLLNAAEARTKPLHIWHAADNVETVGGEVLISRARAMAWRFRERGLRPNDIAVLMARTSSDVVAGILAVWGCGAAVCLIPHEIGRRSGDLDQLALGETLELLKPKLIFHEERHNELLCNYSQLRVSTVEIETMPDRDAFPVHPCSDSVAVIQLTSGSTSRPKGVTIRHGQLLANTLAICERAGIHADDHGVSWLPLYHDMGLSAVTLPLLSDMATTLIPTAQFGRRPMVWLEAISRQQATISPAPAFAYGLLARRMCGVHRTGIDLSTWRLAWVGAEPVFAGHIAAFVTAMERFGLKAGTLQPAYGMAESVVASSFNAPGTPYGRVDLDATELRKSGRVRLRECGTAGETVTLVSNGRLLQGLECVIRREDGSVAPPYEQGEIWIKGQYVAEGYLGDVERERFCHGWYNTGDLGFLMDDELYVSGRAKDLVIRGGVNISPAHIEWAVERLLDLRPGLVGAFSCIDPVREREEVVVVVGNIGRASHEREVSTKIVTAVATETGVMVDKVRFLQASRLPKTTSGKLQRGVLRQMYIESRFANGNTFQSRRASGSGFDDD